MKTKVGVTLLLIAALVLGLVACSPQGGSSAGSGKIKIGVSLPTLREERWAVDYRGFVEAAERLGIDVVIQVADNNAARQQSQVENMITQGVKVLIIAPHDAVAAKQLVEIAHREKIPVIAYDRPITDGGADLYICVNQFDIGRIMGQHIWDNAPQGNIVFLKGDASDDTVYPMAEGTMSVLKPRLDSGEYRIVMEQFVVDWEPANALRLMEQALTANNNNIQGVIAPNDGTAGGVIQALGAQGLAGRVPVTGQDCETDAIKRIIDGTQGMTILYDNLRMSEAALQAAVSLANKGPSGATGTDSDGTPLLDFPPVEITRNNYRQALIDTGLMDEDDLH
ncbi:MAG: substrate-binding domain-containing protein [Treponema sp.]|nr:substrate-binding domain-containing protein [Treponema sp.]